MRNVGRFRRLSFVLGTVVVLVAALVGTQLATRPVSLRFDTQRAIRVLQPRVL